MAGSRAIITGAGSGIGAATARRLAADGFAVALVGRTEARLAQTRDEIRAELPGAELSILPFDVGRRDCDALVDDAVGVLGGLDVVVNSAAAFEQLDSLDFDADRWDDCLDVALRGGALIAAAAARHMSRSGGGRIILVGSVSAEWSMPGSGPYSAAKAGTVALARAMAVDLAAHGIVVNAVSPGWVDTPMNEYFDATPEALASLNPLGRMATAAEIAGVIAYLAVEAPKFLTGSNIVVDGGELAGGLRTAPA